MGTPIRISRRWQAVAAVLLVFPGSVVRAEPPADTSAASDAQQPAEVKGGLFSSLAQAFSEDFDREVVRGHFDVGTPPNTHRYYCLVDPKHGKNEKDAVAGQPFKRRDGMTGIRNAAVSPLSCADAEKKGLLVTADYTVNGRAGSANTAAAAAAPPPPAPLAASSASTAMPAPPVPAPTAAASAAGSSTTATPAATSVTTTATMSATAAPAAAAAAIAGVPMSAGGDDSASTNEVRAVYARFIAAQNAHDRGLLSEVLLDSKDFVWASYAGNSVWGYDQALQAFEQQWKGTWRMEPQAQELRVASVAPGVAVLVAPLLFTAGDPGKLPSTVPVRWGGVFVKAGSGWRISSVFMTPYR